MSRSSKETAVPPALRSGPPGWRDPRLWVGVVLVTGSVVVGSQVLASADDTTAVWAAGGELAEGQVLRASDLVEVRVRFAEGRDAERYVRVDQDFPDDVTLSRPLGAGELVPVAALGSGTDGSVVSVAVAIPPDQVPHDLRSGSRVDVWVVPETDRRRGQAEVVLEDVAVLAVPAAAGSFGATGAQQVVVGVPETEDEALGRLLAASSEERVRLVGRAGR